MPSRLDRRRRIDALGMLAGFPDALLVPQDEQQRYSAKLGALCEYRDGGKVRDIERKFHLSRQHLHYLLDRIRQKGTDGELLGHRALLNGHAALRSFPASILSLGKPVPGALQALFNAHSQLRQTMLALVIHGKLPTSTFAVPRSAITASVRNAIFHEECRKLGIKDNEYPFVGAHQGTVALSRWVKREVRRHDQSQRRASDQRKASDPWFSPSEPVSRVLQRVQCDGYSVDVDWEIEVPSMIGEGTVRIRLRGSRLWFIPVIECKSTSILGYSVSLEKNYSASDVARAVRSALVPWKPRQLTIENAKYEPNDGLPNGLDPELAYRCWDEMWLDSLRANWADLSLTTMERTVGCITVVGPVAEPNVRAEVEAVNSLFSQAIEMIKKRGPDSPEPVKGCAEVRLPLSYDALLDCIDLLVARYNNSIAPGTTSTRYAIYRDAIKRAKTVLRCVPADMRADCLKYDVFDTAKISEDRGRLQVWWKDARYEGPGLHLREDLGDKEVLVQACSEDPRQIEASVLDDGTQLGILVVEKRFRATPHSLITRRQASDDARAGGFLARCADIVIAARLRAEKEAKSSESARRRLARMAAEQTAASPRTSPGSTPPPQTASSCETRPAKQPTNVIPFDRDSAELAAVAKLGSSY